jgi:hypothetical protein
LYFLNFILIEIIRYFPAQPVQTSTAIGSSVHNGGAEAYVELQKALNIVGDYRLKTGANTMRWAMPPTAAASGLGYAANQQTTVALGTSAWWEWDYMMGCIGFSEYGNPIMAPVTGGGTGAHGNAFCSDIGSSCFAMATDLETSNGVEISGLNAEEQSDIALLANWSAPQGAIGGTAVATVIEVYSYYDAMIILRENNVLELIQ